MIYAIVGAPNSGKSDIAYNLSEYLGIGATSGQFPGADVPLGLQADYRTEITIAAERALWMGRAHSSGDDRIYWHSMIDSLAYSHTRLTEMINAQSVSDMTMARWSMVCLVIAAMAEDTAWPDLTLYVPYRGNDSDSIRVDRVLKDALDTYEQKYVVIDPSTEAESWLRS